ncbi:MAG: hypothetical protein LUM44_13250 [Pyrinomonadaceae bacterium]|nr:hypothetical protein [Pyrinomonadaceae bacterium]
MLDQLKYELYKNAKDTKFTVLGFDEPYEIELSEVSENKERNGYEMFSLFFTSPKDYFLPQQIYRLAHTELGEGEIFIVPIEESENGYLYQSVFNRLIENKTE